jgi:hypothetical protein
MEADSMTLPLHLDVMFSHSERDCKVFENLERERSVRLR